MHTILVLGGYGFFGTRICHALARHAGARLIIAGRDLSKAQSLARELKLQPQQALAMDAHDPQLASLLQQHGINTVIHTAGPFQGQDYTVAKAAILAGANYIDLADARNFVAGITQLDSDARIRGVLITSGASSLPALSSAVVDHYLPRFKKLTSIRHGIGSGARAPGIATMRGVFSYCGKPFSRLEDGRLRTVYGWQGTLRYRFPAPVGARLLGSCDVPDLTLFPTRYPDVHTVTFHAGFASAIGHLFIWATSFLVRVGLLQSLTPLVPTLNRISHWMEKYVSDKGGMFVAMDGLDQKGAPLHLTWHLIAAQHHGPHIPCGAAIALAKKLIDGASLPQGAMPCMGLLSVAEYLNALHGYDIQEIAP